MSRETSHTAYNAIHTAWNNNASMSDIYHLILSWIDTWKPDQTYPEIAAYIQDWFRRAEDGDETNDLVEEFVYGRRYKPIRDYFDQM